MGETYSRKELAGEGKQRVFSGDDLQQIAFPLGGLGAGCLHLGGAGNFQDFCLFNNPDFGHSPMTFAAVHCREKGRKSGVMRVLEGPVQVTHIYNQARFGNGGLAAGHEGLPHMEAAEFRGEFPFAWVRLKDRDLPLQVSIEGYSPLIPGDDVASGLPAAFVTYRLKNKARRRVELQFSFNVQYPAKGDLHGHQGSELKGHRVAHRRQGKTAGLYFDSDLPDDHPGTVSIAVVSPLVGQKADCAWFRGGWFDALTMLTNQLVDGRLKAAPHSPPVMETGRSRFGATLFWNLELRPGEQVEMPLIYCWHAANTALSYGRTEEKEERDEECDCSAPSTYRPFYSTLYADAWEVARYGIGNADSLLGRTRRFHRTLFGSSLPDYVLDAVSANLAILKSPTMLRQQDGMLWNWEGCSYGHGCCAGSCTHVWNYAQAVPYLFPALERTLRDQELKWSMDERGHVTFRSALPTGSVDHPFHAASDGQLGGVMKVYRDWQISGDRKWYIGKWHLCDQGPGPVPADQRFGYEHWLASNILEFTSDAYDTVMYDEDDRPAKLPGYRVDAVTDAVIRYIDAHQDDPFFLFVSYIEPHFQNHLDDYPPPDGYRERYTGGWVPPDLAALGGSTFQHLAGYYGMVRRLDEAYGRLHDALKSLGLDRDTIVLFTSDHGCHFKMRNGEYKRSCHESSIREVAANLGQRLVRRMVAAGEEAPQIEPAPARPSGLRRVTAEEARA